MEHRRQNNENLYVPWDRFMWIQGLIVTVLASVVCGFFFLTRSMVQDALAHHTQQMSQIVERHADKDVHHGGVRLAQFQTFLEARLEQERREEETRKELKKEVQELRREMAIFNRELTEILVKLRFHDEKENTRR